MTQGTYICSVSEKSKAWRVKVLVTEKSLVYTNDKETRLQKLILQDTKGDRVEGIIWGNDIDVLQGTLEPFLTYIVGGAKTQPIKGDYKYATPGITTQWVLTRRAFIKQVTDEAERIPYPPVQSVQFRNIASLADTGAWLDILAVVLNVKEPRPVPVYNKLTPIRECTVVQSDMEPVMLTLWGDFTEQQGAELFKMRKDMPIILCKGLRATSFEGTSLSTLPFSFVSLDPNIPEATTLREWVQVHLEELGQVAGEPVRNHLEAAVNNLEPIQLRQLCDILPDTQAAKVAVTMRITDIHQNVAYTTCPNCNQTQEALAAEKFRCHSCQGDHTAVPRCKVAVRLSDCTRKISATLFEKSADRLLQSTPAEIHAMDDQTMARHLQHIDDKLKPQQVIAQIRATRKNFRDQITRYTVQEWVADTKGKRPTLAIEAGPTSSETSMTTTSANTNGAAEPDKETTPAKKPRVQPTKGKEDAAPGANE